MPKPTGGGCGGVITPLRDHGGPTFFPEVPHSPKRLTDSPTLVNLEKKAQGHLYLNGIFWFQQSNENIENIQDILKENFLFSR